MRSKRMRVAQSACGFMHDRVFSVVGRLPWTMSRGDLDEGLAMRREGLCPSEEISAKVWGLLRSGFNTSQLSRAA